MSTASELLYLGGTMTVAQLEALETSLLTFLIQHGTLNTDSATVAILKHVRNLKKRQMRREDGEA